MELVKELAVTEDKQKEEQNKKRIEELTSTIKDLQKQQPDDLANPLSIAVDAHVLAHDVLDGLDGC